MKTNGRLMMFSLVASVVYTLAYYFDWPLIQYLVAEKRFGFAAGANAGPAILWYGWMGTAVLAGAAAALLVPQRAAAKLPADLIWLVPVAAIIAALIYEQRWFY